MLLVSTEAVAELNELAFTCSEAGEEFLHFCFEGLLDNHPLRIGARSIFQGIAKKLFVVIEVTAWSIQAHNTPANCQEGGNLLHAHSHPFSEFFQSRIGIQVLL